MGAAGSIHKNMILEGNQHAKDANLAKLASLARLAHISSLLHTSRQVVLETLNEGAIGKLQFSVRILRLG